MNKKKYELSNPPNTFLFKENGGYWLELSAFTARLIFANSSIELCVYDGESESVIASPEQLEEAIANNEMIVIYIGDVEQPAHEDATPDKNIRWDLAEADVLDTGVIITFNKKDNQYHLCNKDGYSFYYADTKQELLKMYFHNDMDAYTYDN